MGELKAEVIDRSERIRLLNDGLRGTFLGRKVVMTASTTDSPANSTRLSRR
jgi:hypothetical protein